MKNNVQFSNKLKTKKKSHITKVNNIICVKKHTFIAMKKNCSNQNRVASWMKLKKCITKSAIAVTGEEEEERRSETERTNEGEEEHALDFKTLMS